jgi:hypothetical protein
MGRRRAGHQRGGQPTASNTATGGQPTPGRLQMRRLAAVRCSTVCPDDLDCRAVADQSVSLSVPDGRSERRSDDGQMTFEALPAARQSGPDLGFCGAPLRNRTVDLLLMSQADPVQHSPVPGRYVSLSPHPLPGPAQSGYPTRSFACHHLGPLLADGPCSLRVSARSGASRLTRRAVKIKPPPMVENFGPILARASTLA